MGRRGREGEEKGGKGREGEGRGGKGREEGEKGEEVEMGRKRI